MSSRLTFIAALFIAIAGPALANSWQFSSGAGTKFGYTTKGYGHFDPLWFLCEKGGRIGLSAVVGTKRPPSGRGRATVTSGSRRAVVEGRVPEEDFDGAFSIEATIGRDHPVIDVLRVGGTVIYQPTGGKRERLSSRGLSEGLSRFLAACR